MSGVELWNSLRQKGFQFSNHFHDRGGGRNSRALCCRCPMCRVSSKTVSGEIPHCGCQQRAQGLAHLMSIVLTEFRRSFPKGKIDEAPILAQRSVPRGPIVRRTNEGDSYSSDSDSTMTDGFTVFTGAALLPASKNCKGLNWGGEDCEQPRAECRKGFINGRNRSDERCNQGK
jgi:hypothetical protein